MKLWFEKNLLSTDSGVVVQNRDIFNAAGYSSLIIPMTVTNNSVSKVTDIAFAFFVKGLTPLILQKSNLG